MTRSTAEALLAVLLLAAPATAQKQGDDGVLRALLRGTEELHRDDWTAAGRAFEGATSAIGGIWGNTPEVRRARSLWYEESVKPFRGDPYERMMAFYYHGLTFLRAGDWGNAQASFRNAVLQDAFAEEEQNNHDVALPLFLQGWALQAQGSAGAAEEAYRLVAQMRPGLPIPDPAAQPNVLVIVETGHAPRKVADGVGSYKLKFFRGKDFTESRVTLAVDGQPASPLHPVEDVYWQAASRGGRKVDWIFEGKAQYAARNENVGSALSGLSVELSLQSYAYSGGTASALGTASDALGVVGIAALALSTRARPAVDTRYWDNLPDAVHLTTLTLPPGEHELRLDFADASGGALPDLTRTLRVRAPDAGSGPQLVWVSARDRTSRYLSRAGKR